MTTFTVTAGSDHLTKVSRASPVAALSELIWNSLDADSKRVSVILSENHLDSVEEILIVDDGRGMPHEDAEVRFAQLGGSWKRSKGISEGGRYLHGSEGKGRFKALSLGRVVTWSVVYSDSIDLKRYSIQLRADIPNKIEVTAAETAEAGARPGVTVRIEEVGRPKSTFVSDAAIGDFNETFATYLVDYRDVVVEVDGIRLDPGPFISDRTMIPLPSIEVDGVKYDARIDLIEWVDQDRRALFLANERGAPLLKTNRKFQVGGACFTAYLRSSYISLIQEQEALDLAELNGVIIQWIDGAQDAIREHFDRKAAETTQSIIKDWKEQQVYPFKGEPETFVQAAERQVFDIVATHVAKHVAEYKTGTRQSQALHLNLLKTAIEKSPDELQRILSEVVNLPKREQARLANLLRDVSLISMINASAVVTDRLKLIMGLQTLVYESDFRKKLKERTQLHRIVAQNAWLFGEEWSISVDDRSLTQALRAHRHALGDEICIDDPVKHVSKTRGIIDLMLSRTIRRYGSKNPSHLVVELKAPKVTITQKEVTQIQGYARSVSEDVRFDKTQTEWDFWVLSTDMDDNVRFMVEHNQGVLVNRPNLKIRVKLWSEVLEENRSRMQFYKELLEYDASEDAALSHLSERYADLLAGVVELDDAEEERAS